VLAVIESLRLTAPVLMGHSLGGDELTAIGAQRSDRIAGLVYLDATADPRDDYTEFNSRIQQLPPAIRSLPEWSGGLPAPSVADRSSFVAYQRWTQAKFGVEWPESELRNNYLTNEDGSVGPYKTPRAIGVALRAGGRMRDYSQIRVPILAFCWFPPSLAERMKKYPPTDAAGVAAVAKVREVELKLGRQRVRSLFNADAPVQVIEMQATNHFLFMSDEAFVLGEVRAFLKRLPSN
jgi:pimeloyl-ACP methyl ester carboxylesterase